MVDVVLGILNNIKRRQYHYVEQSGFAKKSLKG